MKLKDLDAYMLDSLQQIYTEQGEAKFRDTAWVLGITGATANALIRRFNK